MTPILRGMQMRLPLATRMVTRDMPLFPLFILLPYSTTTGSQFLVRWKGMLPLSPMGFGQDLITSPYSPALLRATFQETGKALYPLHMERTGELSLHHSNG
jgi:hypothetical protein